MEFFNQPLEVKKRYIVTGEETEYSGYVAMEQERPDMGTNVKIDPSEPRDLKECFQVSSMESNVRMKWLAIACSLP